jgi:hypothetical protein
MKKVFLFAITAIFSITADAQAPTLQTVFDNGNIISSNNKFFLLNRSATNFHFGLQWQTNYKNDFFVGLRELGDSSFHIFNYGTASDALTIKKENGFIGIGTMNPRYNLQIQKTSLQPAMMISGNYGGSPRLQLFDLGIDPQAWMGLGTDMGSGPYEHSIFFPSMTAGKLTFGDYNGTSYNVRMSILNSGNVGIGTLNPKSKLAVAGTITAQRVRVTAATAADWADYVFHDDYKLPALCDIEKYIIEHKHLPDIPSATEVEQNGIDLGEMNKKLLQKIEELTLHLINQQKEITELKEWKKNIEKK